MVNRGFLRLKTISYLEYTLVKHIGRRVFFLRVISDTFLAPKCDWTYRTFVKFNEAVILPVSAQMLGAREDFSRDLKVD
jgi:hypothetical protein